MPEIGRYKHKTAGWSAVLVTVAYGPDSELPNAVYVTLSDSPGFKTWIKPLTWWLENMKYEPYSEKDY